jgi:hypothetical protein
VFGLIRILTAVAMMLNPLRSSGAAEAPVCSSGDVHGRLHYSRLTFQLNSASSRAPVSGTFTGLLIRDLNRVRLSASAMSQLRTHLTENGSAEDIVRALRSDETFVGAYLALNQLFPRKAVQFDVLPFYCFRGMGRLRIRGRRDGANAVLEMAISELGGMVEQYWRSVLPKACCAAKRKNRRQLTLRKRRAPCHSPEPWPCVINSRRPQPLLSGVTGST